MPEIYQPSKDFIEKANINLNSYQELYKRSIEEPESFFAEQAQERLSWFKNWDQVLEADFSDAKVKWFKGGKINASYNCLDRHLESDLKDKTALLWEGDDPNESTSFTYSELSLAVNRFSSVLRNLGVKKGDRVLLYLPNIPELAISVLACARIGAVHSVVFGGFSPEALASRSIDCNPKVIITADGAFRGGKVIPLKKNVDDALKTIPAEKQGVQTVIVVKRVAEKISIDWNTELDSWWDELHDKPDVQDFIEPEQMDSEDPLFILYTSGSTGKPKGVLHTTAGYLLGATLSTHYVFDLKPGDIYWCTADVGWITGHSYLVYGPLSNGATSIMFEGVPTYPDAGRFWDVVDKYKVSIFYTAPTAIRALAKEGDQHVTSRKLDSLRLLGTVGEPINPEAWEWYYKIVGNERCPIVDTWWQTETGSIMITPLPGAIGQKPGSATLPFFGVKPALLDNEGKEVEGEGSGNLCIAQPWPSMMRGVYQDEERFYQTYFSQFKGYYFTGDGAKRDADGYYWITGRVDDVLNVSGHRIGTAEVESALVEHKQVAEAAVVGYPHEIKGQGIYAYITLNSGVSGTGELEKELIDIVSRIIGKIARPDKIQWAPALPKTRSGKIMRRILRKIACGEIDSLGDTSTLADPTVVQQLIDEAGNLV